MTSSSHDNSVARYMRSPFSFMMGCLKYNLLTWLSDLKSKLFITRSVKRCIVQEYGMRNKLGMEPSKRTPSRYSFIFPSLKMAARYELPTLYTLPPAPYACIFPCRLVRRLREKIRKLSRQINPAVY